MSNLLLIDEMTHLPGIVLKISQILTKIYSQEKKFIKGI